MKKAILVACILVTVSLVFGLASELLHAESTHISNARLRAATGFAANLAACIPAIENSEESRVPHSAQCAVNLSVIAAATWDSVCRFVALCSSGVDVRTASVGLSSLPPGFLQDASHYWAFRWKTPKERVLCYQRAFHRIMSIGLVHVDAIVCRFQSDAEARRAYGGFVQRNASARLQRMSVGDVGQERTGFVYRAARHIPTYIGLLQRDRFVARLATDGINDQWKIYQQVQDLSYILWRIDRRIAHT